MALACNFFAIGWGATSPHPSVLVSSLGIELQNMTISSGQARNLLRFVRPQLQADIEKHGIPGGSSSGHGRDPGARPRRGVSSIGEGAGFRYREQSQRGRQRRSSEVLGARLAGWEEAPIATDLNRAIAPAHGDSSVWKPRGAACSRWKIPRCYRDPRISSNIKVFGRQTQIYKHYPKTANQSDCGSEGCQACLSSEPSREARFRNAKALKKNT